MMNITPRLPGENNKDYSYRVIKANIMSLNLRPGQVISEIDLAAALEISRTPVREVLAMLKEEHLVEVYPQVGTYVSKINLQLIEEAAFMRFTLEKEVLKLACASFPGRGAAGIEKKCRASETAVGPEGTGTGIPQAGYGIPPHYFPRQQKGECVDLHYPAQHPLQPDPAPLGDGAQL